MKFMSQSARVIDALLNIKAVGFVHDSPITFKSGIISPVYVDNRRFPYFPGEWQLVINQFAQLVQEKNLVFDVIAGIETAGIPHSAALGYKLAVPSVFVRKQAKGHGTKSRIEGGEVTGKKVLLIEDHITTGGSSLSGVDALRQAGAEVNDCLAITSYEFEEAAGAFANAQVALHTLVGFKDVLQEAEARGLISPSQHAQVQAWMADPHNWKPA